MYGACPEAQWESAHLDSTGDAGDMGSIPASGRSPGGGSGNPLRYSCLENPMDRGAWWPTVHGIRKSDTTEATEYGMTHNMSDTYYMTCESNLAAKAESQAVSESFY